MYVSHTIHLLVKTQTEVFLDFHRKHPNVKMSQRTFESCKPFFVISARSKDRNTCCRQNVEIRCIFKRCMEFRKKIIKIYRRCVRLTGNYKVYEHLNDAVLDSLCTKDSGEIFHKAECLNRNCSECCVEKLDFLHKELDTSDSCDDVAWEKYEYVTIMMKGSESKKRNTVGKESYKARPYVPVFQRSIAYVSCISISSNLRIIVVRIEQKFNLAISKKQKSAFMCQSFIAMQY